MLKRKKSFYLLFALAVVFLLQLTPITAYCKTIVTVKHGNTVNEILEIIEQYPHSGFDSYKTTAYDKAPSFSAPYTAGSLSADDLADAVNAVKVVRFLSGVPYEEVTFPAELNNIAQHGAVLLAASDQFSHEPTKPADMSDDFFTLGYQGCSEANISAGRSNISSSVLGFMYDAGQSNIIRAGHRRWILNPGNQEFGMGYAKGPNASYGGNRINMHVFAGLGSWECESDSYIAWPSDGAFPIQYLAASENINQVIDCPWSINLGSPYAAPTKDTVVVKLTRTRDGKTWIFDKNTPNLGEEGLSDTKLHLAVDNGGYGIKKAIVFRPDLDSLGKILDGDIFQVEISGIKYTNGTAATLSYEIKFFDLTKAAPDTPDIPDTSLQNVTITVAHNETPLSGASVTIDGQTYVTDTNGNVTIPLKKDMTYEYMITKEGYSSYQSSFLVDSEKPALNIQLLKEVTIICDNLFTIYNGTSQEAVITLDSDVEYTVTYDNSEEHPINAGIYQMVVTVTEEGYVGQAKVLFEIQKAPLTITADSVSKNFGEQDPPLSYTITSGQLYGNDYLTGEITRAPGEESGTYAINQGTLAANDNYNLTFKPGTFKIVTSSDTEVWINPFVDVYDYDWYFKSVKYVHTNKLFSGLTENQFGPNVSVTRGMLVTVLYRAEGKPIVTSSSQFEDVAKGSYYEKAVIWAEEYGIVSGYTDTVFAPDAPILREQIASIFYRYAKYKKLPVEDTENTELVFEDSSDISSYALKALRYCVAKNILYGRTETQFKPLDHATRAEMAAILQRFLTKIQ